MEWEANAFAASLLMNEELVREEWSKEKDLGILAWKFHPKLVNIYNPYLREIQLIF